MRRNSGWTRASAKWAAAKGAKRKTAIGGALPVPLVEQVVNQRAAQRGIAERIGGERLELTQVEDRLRIELVGITQQPVERGDL